MQKENQLKSCCKKGLSSPNTRPSSPRSVSMRGIGAAHTLYPAYQPCGMTERVCRARMANHGFTLIELLVVVLIIGILAAVAVPQYQKAVEKSRATQAMTLVKSVYQAADAYYMANGEWPLTFDELNIEIPWKGTVKADTNHYGAVRSNSDWSLQIQNNSSNIQDIIIVRLTGKYKGGGFIMSKKSDSSLVPPDTLLCYEQWSGNYAISEHGMFCHKLFHGTKIVHGTTAANYTFIQ